MQKKMKRQMQKKILSRPGPRMRRSRSSSALWAAMASCVASSKMA